MYSIFELLLVLFVQSATLFFKKKRSEPIFLVFWRAENRQADYLRLIVSYPLLISCLSLLLTKFGRNYAHIQLYKDNKSSITEKRFCKKKEVKPQKK